MSLVEKVIQKMREAQRSAATRGPDMVFGTVVSAGAHRALAAGADYQPTPERILKINQSALRTAGLLPPEHQRRQIATQYQQIKRPLIANAFGRDAVKLPNGHLIMMASALPGEGKTFTAINLAFSMAREKDIRVLLVDADVAKPHISKLFGVAGDMGLLDVLQDAALDPESLILPTDVAGLSMLAAGRHTEHATELLASERMRKVVARIGARDPQRIVLFDSPPLLLTTESHALAEVVGQIVMVVFAGVTLQQVVLDAISYLEGKSVAMVLNQSMQTAPSGYYYYDYGDVSGEAGNSAAPAG